MGRFAEGSNLRGGIALALWISVSLDIGFE
jgi:hypothetical protein